MTHTKAVELIIPVSWIGALASLAFACFIRFACPCLKSPFGYILLGAWTILPPLWFMFEWQLALAETPPFSAEKKEEIKHYHELARNLWLAFVVILGALTGVGELFKGGD